MFVVLLVVAVSYGRYVCLFYRYILCVLFVYAHVCVYCTHVLWVGICMFCVCEVTMHKTIPVYCLCLLCAHCMCCM